MRSRRSSGGDGFRLCYGSIPLSEEITSCTWALELSAYRIHDPVQLLPECCLRANAFLVQSSPLHTLLFEPLVSVDSSLSLSLLFKFQNFTITKYIAVFLATLEDRVGDGVN